MKKSIVVCLIASTAFLSQGLFADGWGSAKLNKKVDLTLADDEVIQLNVDVGAGDLSIIGKKGQTEIVVIAKVYGEELNDDDYTLSLEKEDDKAVLIAQFNDRTYNNERIDVEVIMPASLALLVDDRSGDILIESVSNGLSLNDRSGDIELKDIAGLVRIEDRSGDVVGKNLRGDVIINDRSGEIQIKDVIGDLTIDDSSGDIRAKNIFGVVTVEDSSGDIDINGASDFKLKNDGSGDVRLQNINKILK
jgi:hypothetical protein